MTSSLEPRRIDETRLLSVSSEPTVVWKPWEIQIPGIEWAGKRAIYRMPISEPLNLVPWDPDKSMRVVALEFELVHYVHREWVVVERGEDEEGPWEKGFYHLFIFYIPIPWPIKKFRGWVAGLLKYWRGIGLR